MSAIGNERLLAARAEIEAVLKHHDIAGFVVLHCPSFTEIFADYQPSYSKLHVEHLNHGFKVHLRSKLEDYGGDVDAQVRDQAATAQMVRSFAEALGRSAMSMIELSEYVDKKLNAEHTPSWPIDNPPS
jgi:hypothetical protein